MHAAPPVRISVVPDRAWAAFVTASASLAAANLIAWLGLWSQVPTAGTAVAALLAAGALGGAAWWAIRRHGKAAGVLAWDGACWHWAPDTAEPRRVELAVMIDLGTWLLLRVAPTAPAAPMAPAIWLATSRRQAALQWPAWRAALYSPRPGGGAVPDLGSR